jgi:hypothetical protein
VNLRHLILANTNVTNAGLKEIAKFKSLESLNIISGTMVTNAAVVELQKVRPRLRIIYSDPK